jgi:ABC-type sugar transport system ATPase subunit
VGFLVSSSDLEDFTSLCDRVLVLGDGRITAELRPPHLTKDAVLSAIHDSTYDPEHAEVAP